MLNEPKNIPRNFIDIGKKLLKDLRDKKITLIDFEKEVAYLALQCGFDELRPQPLPTRPNLLLEYDLLPLDNRLKMPDKFWKQPVIESYTNQRSLIETENKSKKEWLIILRNRFNVIGDLVNRNKCSDKINEFERVPF